MSTVAFAATSGDVGKSSGGAAVAEQKQSRNGWLGKISELPDEAKAKIAELREKLKNGEITREQFCEEMQQIMPEGFQFRGRGVPADLPDEVKEKIAELREKLKNGEITREQFCEEMQQIMPEGFQFRGRGIPADLPDEVKAKIAELREKLKNGEITREQFREEIQQSRQEQSQLDT